MICMNCGAQLDDSAYCPVCGCDISVQKQAIVISGIYYNQGLEKAQIRDLSGAIDFLLRALKFNKMNIQARNLLGLVYFETGEVVAALSEWVISKNIQPEDNPASYFILNLQHDANRLEVINQTIKKFNTALQNCRDGHEDVAMIQLKKVLAQNPKLIKGYHLLSLLYIRAEDYERARKLLRKALKIDRTNTTTLRYLREVEEQTGEARDADKHFRIMNFSFGEKKTQGDPAVRESATTETRVRPFYISLLSVAAGLLIGALLIAVAVVPGMKRRINKEADDRVTEYSTQMAEMSGQITDLKEQVASAQQTSDSAYERINEATLKANSYERLSEAQRYYYAEDTATLADILVDVDPSLLTEKAAASYNRMAAVVSDDLFEKLKKKGQASMESGDYKAAVSAYTRALSLYEDDEDVKRALADAQASLTEAMNSDSAIQTIPAQGG